MKKVNNGLFHLNLKISHNKITTLSFRKPYANKYIRTWESLNGKRNKKKGKHSGSPSQLE